MRVICVVGFSGSGKTLLSEYLIRRFRKEGIETGAVKHARHRISLDPRGKDTWKLAEVGASPVFAVSRSRVLAVYRSAGEDEGLRFALSSCREAGLERVVVEGFKSKLPAGSTFVITASRPRDLAAVLKVTRRGPAAVGTLGSKSALEGTTAAPVFSLKTEKEDIYRIVSGA